MYKLAALKAKESDCGVAGRLEQAIRLDFGLLRRAGFGFL
jgi:hypothetical protein